MKKLREDTNYNLQEDCENCKWCSINEDGIFNNQQRPGPAPRPTRPSAPQNFNNIPNSFSQQPQSQFRQQPRQQQVPQQQFQQQPQRQPQRPAASAPAGGEQTLSLFEQIKQRINREKQLKNQIIQKQNEKERQQQQPQPQQNFRQPQPQQNFRQPQNQQDFRQTQQSFQQQPRQNIGSFGVFEAVDLSGPSPSPLPAPSRSLGSRQTQNEGFFGVFPEVNLQ